MFDPKADDEIVVNDQLASADDVHVGDVLHVQAFALDQPEARGTPHGPVMSLRVVGVVRTAEELLFVPGALVSPGVVAKYRHQAVFDPNAVVRLKAGAAAMTALRRDVNSLVAPGVPVLDLHDTSRRVTTSLAVESFALYMIALALVLAGGLLVAQVLSRSSAFIGDDVGSLRAMGMTRPQIAGAATLSNALAVVVAVVVGLAGAVALSPLFPLGLGRTVDPDVGLHADWTALGVGAALTAGALMAGATLLALAASAREASHAPAQRSAAVSWLGRVAPVPAAIGARMALERGPGARSMPVRPALIGAVAGVLGVVGALTINAGIRHALANPELAGVTWGASVAPPPADVTSTSVSGRLLSEVGRAAPGASVAVVRRDLVDVNGVGVPTVAVQDVGTTGRPVTLAMVSGRPPAARDEAAIGPATAKSLGVFLAVLGLAALSYVLVITGRSRRAEFAVYKALGLDERMSRRIVYFQASVIATVGLAIGVPLGVIAGRWGWAAVTTRVPLVDLSPLSVLVVVLAIPIVFVASNAIAIGPARGVARAKPAEALRSE